VEASASNYTNYEDVLNSVSAQTADKSQVSEMPEEEKKVDLADQRNFAAQARADALEQDLDKVFFAKQATQVMTND
jgi:hypothetical protein